MWIERDEPFVGGRDEFSMRTVDLSAVLLPLNAAPRPRVY